MYYKVTNISETIADYQFKSGLNTNNGTQQMCKKVNGFYFTNSSFLHQHLRDGVYVREIILPISSDLKVVHDKNENIWWTNMFVLGTRYNLSEISTYKMLAFNMSDKYIQKNVIMSMFKYNHFDVLYHYLPTVFENYYNNTTINRLVLGGKFKLAEWFYQRCTENNIDFFYTNEIIDTAAKLNYIDTLEWCESMFEKYNLQLKYSTLALDYASKHNNVQVLNWFENIYLKYNAQLLYTESSVDLSAKNNCLQVLKWFEHMYVDHGIELLYTENAVDFACKKSAIDSLKWFEHMHEKYQLELKYSDSAIDCGSIDSLRWFEHMYIKYNTTLKYTSLAVDSASFNNKIDILNWWLHMNMMFNFALLYSNDSLDYVIDDTYIEQIQQYLTSSDEQFKNSINQHNKRYTDEKISTLIWWICTNKKYNLQLKYSVKLMNDASNSNNIDILNWLINAHVKYNFVLKYCAKALTTSSIQTLEWWLNMYKQQYVSIDPSYSIDNASCSHDLEKLNWWKNVNKLYNIKLDTNGDFLTVHTDAQILKWWNTTFKNCLIVPKFSKNTISLLLKNVSKKGSVNILKWIIDICIQYNIKLDIIDEACRYNNIELLQLCEEKIDDLFMYSESALFNTCFYNNIESAQWLQHIHAKGFTLKYSDNFLENIDQYSDEIVKWLSDFQEKYKIVFKKDN